MYDLGVDVTGAVRMALNDPRVRARQAAQRSVQARAGRWLRRAVTPPRRVRDAVTGRAQEPAMQVPRMPDASAAVVADMPMVEPMAVAPAPRRSVLGSPLILVGIAGIALYALTRRK